MSTHESSASPISSLISITKRLTSVILEENKLLETRRPAEAAALAAEKSRLNTAYEREIMDIKKRGGMESIDDASMLSQLRQETKAFHVALDKHKRILVRLRTVTESMIKAIGDEVSKRANPVQNYGGNAALAPSPYKTPTSLSLNQVI